METNSFLQVVTNFKLPLSFTMVIQFTVEFLFNIFRFSENLKMVFPCVSDYG